MSRVLVIALLLVAWALWAQAQSHGSYVLAVGKVSSTAQEAAECYFLIGQAASVNLHPNGEYCIRMREFVGKTGVLFFVPDE